MKMSALNEYWAGGWPSSTTSQWCQQQPQQWCISGKSTVNKPSSLTPVALFLQTVVIGLLFALIILESRTCRPTVHTTCWDKIQACLCSPVMKLWRGPDEDKDQDIPSAFISPLFSLSVSPPLTLLAHFLSTLHHLTSPHSFSPPILSKFKPSSVRLFSFTLQSPLRSLPWAYSHFLNQVLSSVSAPEQSRYANILETMMP